jgi:sortase A
MRHARVASAVLAIVGVACCGKGAWIRAEALAAQFLLERAWRTTIAEQSPVKPWPWARVHPVAQLVSPDHGVSLVVLSDTHEDSLKLGPGHVATSAMPGTVGNTVVAGHRDTHFRFLQHLRPGDPLVLVRPDGIRLTYRVRQAQVFDDHTPLLEPTDSATLTLITCYPFDHIGPAPLRYAVHSGDGEGAE